jgi:hypothetical protein
MPLVHHKSRLFGLASLLLTNLTPTSANVIVQTGPTFTYADLQTKCLNPLADVDANSDGYLSRPEYIHFIQDTADTLPIIGTNSGLETIENISGYEGLPGQFILTFGYYSCQGVETDDNCNFNLPIAGANGSVHDLTAEQKKNFYRFCKDVLEDVYEIVGLDFVHGPASDVPTSAPSSPPTEQEDVSTFQEINVPFGYGNFKGLDAIAVADNTQGSLKTVIIPALERLGDEVQADWNIEQIGGGERRSLNRALVVDSLAAWVLDLEDSEYLFCRMEPWNNIVYKMYVYAYKFLCSILFLSTVSCPENIMEENSDAKCQKANGRIRIQVFDEDVDEAADKFTAKAQQMIAAGDFQGLLSDQDYYRVFSIVDEPSVSSFPLFAVVGVAAGAVLVGLFAGRALLVNRKARGSQLSDDEMYSEDEFNPSSGNTDIERGVEVDPKSLPVIQCVASGTYGSPDKVMLDDSSSNAGSSGWSSSAGVSSLNTGSVDSVEYFGSSLAAIGAASKVISKYDRQKKVNMYPIEGDDESDSARYV